MRITPDNVEIWMTNYRRFEECNSSVMMWLRSFPFKKINIIVNHSDQNLMRFDSDIRDKINLVYNSIRPNWMMGSLTQCWNTAYLHGFSNKEIDWIICTQDDVNVLPGWDKLINNDKDRLIYFSPQGDVIHMIHREAFYKVGWWDERFRIIKCQEQDYMIRCFNCLNSNQISIVDNHDWHLKYNDIGLDKKWKKSFRTDEINETESPAEIMFMEQFKYFIEKWGDRTDTIFHKKEWIRKKNISEIDWYPSWTLTMKQSGNLPINFEFPK